MLEDVVEEERPVGEDEMHIVCCFWTTEGGKTACGQSTEYQNYRPDGVDFSCTFCIEYAVVAGLCPNTGQRCTVVS